MPLTELSDPPEIVFERCREIIDRRAVPDEHESLLVVTQVLAGLRYNDPKLFDILGGMKAMIESPRLQEVMAEVESRTARKSVLTVLQARFGDVPEQMAVAIKVVSDHDRLNELTKTAASCESLEQFAAVLRG